jgi:lipopolysaccharide transport system permease protein
VSVAVFTQRASVDYLRYVLAAPRSLWRHRTLLRSMVQRDIEVRYRGSMLGALWTLVSPLFLIVVYAVFFGAFMQMRPGPDSEASDYGLFVMAGVLPWLAFSDALSQSTGLISANRNMVRKVVFPLEILPCVSVLSALVNQLIGLALLLAAILLLTDSIPLGVLLLLVPLIPQVLLTLGLCWFLASMGVFLRDLGQAMGILLTAWVFLTPIFYPAEIVPEEFAWIIKWNPMASIVAIYRAILLGQGPLTFEMVTYPLVLGALVFVFGGYWFMRTKSAFADVI